MKRFLLILLVVWSGSLFAQSDEFAEQIKTHPLISIGGCDLLNFQDKDYIVGVAAVDAEGKSMSILRRVAKVKAEREVVTFINGSDITSSTSSYIKEVATTIGEQEVVETSQEFVEKIREDSEGFVKAMKVAAYWFSEDRSVFYYAVYKEVNL